MNHIPFTLLAYFLNGIAVLIDKFMLTKQIPNPLIYVFYFSVFSLLALFLLPTTHYPLPTTLILASTSTLLWTTGAYFMFSALTVGQASRVIPIIGTIIPIILLLTALFTRVVSSGEIFAIVFLIGGLIFLTLPDWFIDKNSSKIKPLELLFTFASAIFFAISYIALRQAYLQENFLTVLVYSRIILIPIIAITLILPITRKIIFAKSEKHPLFHLKSKIGLLFLAGGAAGGASELLLTFSVSLANPALVNSLQGTQYVFIFFASLILSSRFPDVFKESLHIGKLVSKLIGVGLIGLGLYLLAFAG